MKRICSVLTLFALVLLSVYGADPTATNYTSEQCLGSSRPYPLVQQTVAVPDSLIPVFINHVGRHGARFLSSASIVKAVATPLERADSAAVLTGAGKRLLEICHYVAGVCGNRWGALDSLGMAEQRGIASRMYRTYSGLFADGSVSAISSYSPRCVMSMYEFTHQLDRLNNSVTLKTLAGRVTNPLMRPFDVDQPYIDWVKSNAWVAPYQLMFDTTVPLSPARKLLKSTDLFTEEELRDLSWGAYKLLSGLPAMGLSVNLAEFFTPEEQNALWSVANLRHYLLRAANTLSMEPAEVAVKLLQELIDTTDEAARGENAYTVMLRFGHAETLMPLLSLMRLPGCYYMTNYFDTVGLHWQDFNIVPMAANLQVILFRNASGIIYVRFELNEQPLILTGAESEIIPWSTAKKYLERCLPMYLQI